MKQRIFLFTSALAAVFACSISVVPLAAQSSSVAAKPDPKAAGKSDAAYVAPKTPWGTPDLEGTWTSDDTWGVPFERPKQFGTRATLTEDELKARSKNIENSEEFVETGGTNHSPAKAQLDAKEKGEAPPPPQGRFGRGVD